MIMFCCWFKAKVRISLIDLGLDVFMNFKKIMATLFALTVFISANAMESKQHKDIVDEGEDSICAICQNSEEGKFHSLSCGHKFHEACIQEWVHKSSNVCPVCRQKTDVNINLLRLLRHAFEILLDYNPCLKDIIVDLFVSIEPKFVGTSPKTKAILKDLVKSIAAGVLNVEKERQNYWRRILKFHQHLPEENFGIFLNMAFSGGAFAVCEDREGGDFNLKIFNQLDHEKYDNIFDQLNFCQLKRLRREYTITVYPPFENVMFYNFKYYKSIFIEVFYKNMIEVFAFDDDVKTLLNAWKNRFALWLVSEDAEKDGELYLNSKKNTIFKLYKALRDPEITPADMDYQVPHMLLEDNKYLRAILSELDIEAC